MDTGRKSMLFAGAALSALGLAFWLGQRWPMHAPTQVDAGSTQQPAAQASVYVCPMHPHIRQHGPGQCPICGMALVLDRSDAGDGEVVAVSAGLQQSLGVRIEALKRRSFHARLEAPLSLSWDERAQWVEQTRVGGFVSSLSVRNNGERVRKGQLLAEIFAPEAAAAIDDYRWLREHGDPRLLDAAEARLRRLGLDPATATRHRSSGEPRFPLYARADGLVESVEVAEGAAVAMGMPLMRMRSDTRLWAVAELREDQVDGDWQELRVELAAFPGEDFAAQPVGFVPALDEGRRTLAWRLALDNPDGRLRPGMQGLLRGQGTRYQVLALPSEALIVTGERRAVVVEQEPGRFRSVEVLPGRELDGYIAIRRGLAEGQRVVVNGQFLIDAEASLRRALPSADAAGPDAGHRGHSHD